jgi:hypothetical protein
MASAGGTKYTLEDVVSKMQELGKEHGKGRQEVMEDFAAVAKGKEAAKKKREEQREAAGGSTKACAECRRIGRQPKRCTGCYLTIYCSVACQRTAWPGHKADCKQVRNQFRPVLLRPMEAER